VRGLLGSVLLGGAVASGCVPSLDGAERVLVYDYVDEDLGLVEAPLRIATDDLVQGRSPQTQILIGGELRFGANGIEASGGRVPILPARVDDGLLVPDDGDALSFFSFLVHLQTASEWFLDREMADSRLFADLGSRYELFVPTATEWRDQADNAGYFPPTHDFFLGPNERAPGAPIMASPGVVGHELGHAVQVATGASGSLRAGCLGDTNRAACRTINGMDEGLSDLWAAGIWPDPAFVLKNFGDRAADRDMRDLKPLPEDLLNGTLSDTEDGALDSWDPHTPGAIWASWWWAIGEELGDDGLDRVITLSWSMTRAIGALDPDATFGVVEMCDLFLADATADERSVACAVFVEQLGDAAEGLTRCE